MTSSDTIVLSSDPQRIGTVTLRNFTWDDFDALVGLSTASKREQIGSGETSDAELRTEYELPGFEALKNVRVAYDDTGKMVAAGEFWATNTPLVRPWSWGYVLPEFRGQGLGTALIAWAKLRAAEELNRAPEGSRVCLLANATDLKPGSIELIENEGFKLYTTFYTMMTELDALPDEPVWPAGTRVVDVNDRQGDITDFVRLKLESFRDHRNALDQPFETELEQWQHEVEHSPGYRPDLWLLAEQDGEPAAVVLGFTESGMFPDTAWVAVVGVLPRFRRQGLAQALLVEMFRRFYRERYRKIGLGVDGSSLTNAVALYERVGMQVAYRWPSYELEIRAGVEITPQ
jgi:GNAT superfamily N-acetyltransferase